MFLKRALCFLILLRQACICYLNGLYHYFICTFVFLSSVLHSGFSFKFWLPVKGVCVCFVPELFSSRPSADFSCVYTTRWRLDSLYTSAGSTKPSLADIESSFNFECEGVSGHTLCTCACLCVVLHHFPVCLIISLQALGPGLSL